MNLLVIEDERKTADALKTGLEENGYKVDVANGGEEGLELLKHNKYHIVISDIVMPRMDGINLCRLIRQQQNSVPILLLTALDAKDDVVNGLDAGADDYLTKPFDFRELLARIRSLAKRTDPAAGSNPVLQFDELVLNLRNKTVQRGATDIELTAKEFKLLEYFIRRPDTVISRADLARDIWNIDFDTGTNVVEVYINYLRNKIDKPFAKKLIHNIHGVGYILRASKA